MVFAKNSGEGPSDEVASYLEGLRSIKARAGESAGEQKAREAREKDRRQARAELRAMADERPSNEVRHCFGRACANPFCLTPAVDFAEKIGDSWVPVCARHVDHSHETVHRSDL